MCNKINEANFNGVISLLNGVSLSFAPLLANTTTAGSTTPVATGAYVYTTPAVSNMSTNTVVVAPDYNTTNIFSQLSPESLGLLQSLVLGRRNIIMNSYIIAERN